MNIFIIIIVALLAWAIKDMDAKPAYKYRIYDSNRNTYYTDSYTKDKGCIIFDSNFRGGIIMCGSYVIINQTSKEKNK